MLLQDLVLVGCSWVATVVSLCVVTMSRQRFPCRDRDSRDKRSGLRRNLVKTKRFHVAIGICSVVTGFHGVVSRYMFLCRDRVGNGGEILCRDIIFYVTTECCQG